MVGKIIFIAIAFILFVYMFLYKLVKKNDTVYISVLVLQAIGIAINCIQILFNFSNILLECISFVLSIVLPIFIIVIEKKGINIHEVFTVLRTKNYLKINNIEDAKKELIDLTNKYPNSYYAHKMLGKIYEEEKEISKSIDEYVKAIELRRNDYDSYFEVAVMLRKVGKKDEAIVMLNNLVKNKPDYYEAIQQLGDLLCEQEKYKEAANLYINALQYNENVYDIYYNLGMVYTMLNDFNLAKEYYEKAAEVNHLSYNSYYSLAQIALLYREIELAEEYFNKSLDTENKELEALVYYQLAKIAIMRNEKDKAIHFINQAIMLDAKIIDRVNGEKIFESIINYISTDNKEIEKEEIEDDRSDLEKRVDEHLVKTLELTKKMNLKDIYNMNKKEVIIQNENYKERTDNN